MLKQYSATVKSYLKSTKQPPFSAPTAPQRIPHVTPNPQPSSLAIRSLSYKAVDISKMPGFSHFVLDYSSWIWLPCWDRKHNDFVILSEICEVIRAHRVVPCKLEWMNLKPFSPFFGCFKECILFSPLPFFLFSCFFLVYLCKWCCLR